MRVVLLTGNDPVGGAEHRYVAQVLRERLGSALVGIIVSSQPRRPLGARLKRMWRRSDIAALQRRAARGVFQTVTRTAARRASRCAALLLGRDDPRTLLSDLTHVVPDHNGDACLKLLDELQPDIIAVYGTRVIKTAVMAKARIETLNLHTGLSPFYRGDSTLFWPIYFGEPDKLGVTIHRLAPELDGGAMIATAVTPFVAGDDEAAVFARAVRQGAAMYADAIAAVGAGVAQFVPQPLGVGREFRNVERTVRAELRVWWLCWRARAARGAKLYHRRVTSTR